MSVMSSVQKLPGFDSVQSNEESDSLTKRLKESMGATSLVKLK